jgi:hypothetical protein
VTSAELPEADEPKRRKWICYFALNEFFILPNVPLYRNNLASGGIEYCAWAGPKRSIGMADEEPSHVRYRRLAQQCMDMLSSISHAPARESVLEMAKTWLRLAQDYEQRSEPQPVGQQQQQIQPKK